MTNPNTREAFMSTKDNSNCSLQVRVATQSWEKSEIYRLRYEVYVEEMGKPLGPIIHKRKQLTDSLDDRSILLYAQTGSEIIATVRTTIAVAEDYPSDLAEVFQMNKFKSILSDLSKPYFGLGTKLAVRAHYRNSPALYLIIAEAYRLLRHQNVQLCFTGCNPYLIPLYERLGFRRFAGNFTDPGYGLLISLAMVVEDSQYFQSVQSPLYRHVRKYTNNLTNVQRILRAFPQTFNWSKTLPLNPENLWKYAECKLKTSPIMIPAFKTLDEENVKNLLLSGVIFSCMPGDCIVYQGSIYNDLYILLSGALAAESTAGSRLLRPGDHLDGLTHNDRSPQREVVTAVTESELIVIPRSSFERYQRLQPAAAAIVWNNLSCTQDFTYNYELTNKEV